MTSSAARKAKGERAELVLFDDVTNPFCGLLPDDLVVERTDQGLKVLKNGCGKSVTGFERKLPPSSPKVNGKDVGLDKAIKEAAQLLGKAKLPLYGGLATDVEGMRAVIALAERTSGIVDHALSEAQYRNFKVLQTTGWVMTTLTEARNRADLFDHRRQRHPGASSAFLRDDRLPARFNVRCRGTEAHGGVQRLRSLEEVGEKAGGALAKKYVGRAALTADFWNRGRQDLLMTNLDGSPVLLRNEVPSPGHWLRIKTIGSKSNRDGFGAKVEITVAGVTRYAEVRAGSSFESSSDPRVHFGLGAATKVDAITVRWPSGQVDKLGSEAADQELVVREERDPKRQSPIGASP